MIIHSHMINTLAEQGVGDTLQGIHWSWHQASWIRARYIPIPGGWGDWLQQPCPCAHRYKRPSQDSGWPGGRPCRTVCPEGQVAQCYALCFVGSPHCPEASEEEEECHLRCPVARGRSFGTRWRMKGVWKGDDRYASARPGGLSQWRGRIWSWRSWGHPHCGSSWSRQSLRLVWCPEPVH